MKMNTTSGREMTIMTDELYDLYKRDPDFAEYVDKWAHNHNLSIFEVFRFDILKEYAKWLKENKHDKR